MGLGGGMVFFLGCLSASSYLEWERKFVYLYFELRCCLIKGLRLC